MAARCVAFPPLCPASSTTTGVRPGCPVPDGATDREADGELVEGGGTGGGAVVGGADGGGPVGVPAQPPSTAHSTAAQAAIGPVERTGITLARLVWRRSRPRRDAPG